MNPISKHLKKCQHNFKVLWFYKDIHMREEIVEDKMDFYVFFFANFSCICWLDFIFDSFHFLICISRICWTLFLTPSKSNKPKGKSGCSNELLYKKYVNNSFIFLLTNFKQTPASSETMW